jgi:hypothetical protein
MLGMKMFSSFMLKVMRRGPAVGFGLIVDSAAVLRGTAHGFLNESATFAVYQARSKLIR